MSSWNNITVDKRSLFYLQLSSFVGQAVTGMFLGPCGACRLCSPAASNQIPQTSFIHISSYLCGLRLKTKGRENLLLLKTLH